MNPLKELQYFGQAFWLDYIRRSLIQSGELSRLRDENGLRGVTSNPTIFQKAIAGSPDYDAAIKTLVETDIHMNVQELYEKLVITDIQMVADILRPIYDETNGSDGFVSLELSPRLAHDTQGSIAEARRLWKAIKRPNVMLKVPATPEGVPVIETLITEGINTNVTLIFSLSQYKAVAKAYIRGLERQSTPHKVASVASFFLSRIDRVIDKKLDEINTPEALKYKGKTAIASAKMAYNLFKKLFSGERWESLADKDAQVQRLLWASTSTKNPSFSDVLYVEPIIGQDTVNTMPPVTLNAFREHGQVNSTLEEGLEEVEETLKQLERLNIDLNKITEELQIEGVKAFEDSFNELLSTLEEKRQAILKEKVDIRIMKLGKYQAQIEKRLENWNEINFIRRIWAKDPTLWFSKPVSEITDRLGWLVLPETMEPQIEDFLAFSEKVKSDGIRHVVLLGMGGSSLAPDVFSKVFGSSVGYPELMVLDSTHPSAIRTVESKIDLRQTLFIVSSKSGTTLETLSLFRYFWKKVSQITKNPGYQFIAITDPGTPLVQLGEQRGFRRIFKAPPDVGGRYSALTDFGMIPASLIGMDLHKLLDRAYLMSENCAFCVSSHDAIGLKLGAALGELAKVGRDKITFFTSSSIKNFPVWLEQLLAESTGKDGKGIIPIVNEPIGNPEIYGSDRFFIYFFHEKEKAELNSRMKALEDAGHPVIYINLTEKINLSQEMFCWEMATAAAGSVLGIHPFNQPDVQMAKDLAKKMMSDIDKGTTNEKTAETISVENPEVLAEKLKEWLSQAREGDYVAIQAYLEPKSETTELLQKIRIELLYQLHKATTLGYGPRFLHSTGQLHKGGPNIGLFLQLVDESEEDLTVPETNYTFGQIIQAQALGDYYALKQLNRRVLRINLKKDVKGGLSQLLRLIKEQK